jgi:hypothetical protein
MDANKKIACKKGNYARDRADDDEPERINGQFSCIQSERSIKGQLCEVALLLLGILIGGWAGAILLVGGNGRCGCAVMLFGVALRVWAFGWAGGLWALRSKANAIRIDIDKSFNGFMERERV